MTFADPEPSSLGDYFKISRLGDYFKMPGVYRNKMPVWEQGSGDIFLFYEQNKHWMLGRDYQKDAGYVASKESGLTQLPLTGWQTSNGAGWKDAPLRLITRDQAQGDPWVQDIERSRRVTCGGKEAPSCLDCSTCDTDCFTWLQKWSLQKPCVSKQCKCRPCSFF